jgi:hypothetical protein
MPFIGGLIAGAGSLFGGLLGSNAATSAAKTQAQSNQQAIQAQLGEFQQQRGDEAPFIQTGGNAISSLAGLLGLANVPGVATGSLNQNPAQLMGLGPEPTLSIPDPSNPATIAQFQQSPGYQYELGQQQNALQNSAAGKTGAISGNMLKALQQNAQGLASQDYGSWLTNATNFGTQNYAAGRQNYFDQYSIGQNQQANLFQRLLSLAGLGQGAAAGQGTTGTQLAGNVGGAQIGAGNALAAGQVGSANALTGGVNNLLTSLLAPNVGNNSGQSSLAALLAQFGGGGGFSDAFAQSVNSAPFTS